MSPLQGCLPEPSFKNLLSPYPHHPILPSPSFNDFLPHGISHFLIYLHHLLMCFIYDLSPSLNVSSTRTGIFAVFFHCSIPAPGTVPGPQCTYGACLLDGWTDGQFPHCYTSLLCICLPSMSASSFQEGLYLIHFCIPATHQGPAS